MLQTLVLLLTAAASLFGGIIMLTAMENAKESEATGKIDENTGMKEMDERSRNV